MTTGDITFLSVWPFSHQVFSKTTLLALSTTAADATQGCRAAKCILTSLSPRLSLTRCFQDGVAKMSFSARKCEAGQPSSERAGPSPSKLGSVPGSLREQLSQQLRKSLHIYFLSRPLSVSSIQTLSPSGQGLSVSTCLCHCEHNGALISAGDPRCYLDFSNNWFPLSGAESVRWETLSGRRDSGDITKELPVSRGQGVKHVQPFCKLPWLLALWKVPGHLQHVQMAVTSQNSLPLRQWMWEQNAGAVFSALHMFNQLTIVVSVETDIDTHVTSGHVLNQRRIIFNGLEA